MVLSTSNLQHKPRNKKEHVYPITIANNKPGLLINSLVRVVSVVTLNSFNSRNAKREISNKPNTHFIIRDSFLPIQLSFLSLLQRLLQENIPVHFVPY